MQIRRISEDIDGWWGFTWKSKYHNFNFELKNWWLKAWLERNHPLKTPLIPFIGFDFDITYYENLAIRFQIAFLGFDMPVYLGLGKTND